MTRKPADVLETIKRWAKDEDVVRTVILTGSRAQPHAVLDALSDYDLVVYATDLSAFSKGDEWLSAFGEVMVRWPRMPRSTLREDWITRLVLFSDGVRIDFQIGPVSPLVLGDLDAGYEVLVDKDGATASLQAPTHSAYHVARPSYEAYASLVNDFWWDATYVAKYLRRDELPFAAHMLGQMLRDRFLRMILEWDLGCKSGWTSNAGVHGRYLKRLLEPAQYEEYLSTYAGAEIEENWAAFFNLLKLFRKLAMQVGQELGYDYPSKLDADVSTFCMQIRESGTLS